MRRSRVPTPTQKPGQQSSALLHMWSRHQLRLVGWALFGCIASLLPVLIQIVQGIDSPGGITFNGLFGNGDLLIIAATLAAGALGEVIAASRSSWLTLLLTFCCGSELLVTSLWYADLRTKLGQSQIVEVNGNRLTYSIDPHSVALGTVALYVLTVGTCVFSLYCIWRREST
jgi:hypothetical protein